MKKIITLAGGFLGYFMLEGLVRLVILFYHRQEFAFYGTGGLPGNLWIIIILCTILISTWLISMLIFSIQRKDTLLMAMYFGAILVSWRIFELIRFIETEALWYLILLPLIHITGIYLAYKLYTSQEAVHEIS